MKISIHTLQQVLPDAVFHGFNGDEVFSLFNIAHLKQFDYSIEAETLYFVVYEDNPEKEGWYNESFDRTKNLASLVKKAHISFVIDNRADVSVFSVDTKYIYVKDIFSAIIAITKYVIAIVNPIVIGITGSVGKTTTAALVEDVIAKGKICKRIYSKRLTPLTLSSWLVNFLDTETEVLVLEYSMYRPQHIKVLAELLPPTYGVLLNIKRMHLGVRGIDSVDDIVNSKSELLNASSVSLINFDEKSIRKLVRENSLVFSLAMSDSENKKMHACAVSSENGITVNLPIKKLSLNVNPYIYTKLFVYQSLVAILLGVEFDIPVNKIEHTISTFQPEENRIQWVKIKGFQYLFDGDVTISARLQALAENMYRKTLLIVISFDFGEENVEIQIDDFNVVFRSFSEVRILNSLKNNEVIEKFCFQQVNLVDQKSLFLDQSSFDFKVIHYGTYFRKYDNLTELQTYFMEK